MKGEKPIKCKETREYYSCENKQTMGIYCNVDGEIPLGRLPTR